jgi:hypothetical protein
MLLFVLLLRSKCFFFLSCFLYFLLEPATNVSAVVLGRLLCCYGTLVLPISLPLLPSRLLLLFTSIPLIPSPPPPPLGTLHAVAVASIFIGHYYYRCCSCWCCQGCSCLSCCCPAGSTCEAVRCRSAAAAASRIATTPQVHIRKRSKEK